PSARPTTGEPGCTAGLSPASSGGPGTCSVVLGCEMFGNILCPPFDLGELAPPAGAVPDLEVVVDACDDDVATELRVLEQRAGKSDAPLLVELALGRGGEEEALHAPAPLAERVEGAETLTDDPLPGVARIGEEAPVHA